MNLSSRLAQDFPISVRRRGQEYQWQGLVRIENGSDTEVRASIRGSQRYDVELSWKPGELTVYCDCPYFESTGPCKHIWATILTAETQGQLSSAAADPELKLHDELSLEHDLLRAPRPTTDAPPPAAWRRQLATIAESTPRLGWPPVWPEKREILYVVDVAASVATNGLVLNLETRDRKKDGSYSRVVRASIKRDQIPRLPLHEDREIMAALAGASQYWGYSYSAGGDISSQSRLDHPLNC